MKKIIVLMLFLILSCATAFADIIPTASTSIAHYGFGVVNLPDSFSVYAQPDESSKVLKVVNYEEESNGAIVNQKNSLEGTIIAFVPSKSIALAVVETNQENGWYEIYYDQRNGKTGWVKQPNSDSFKTWKDAFYCWGKQNGIYIFRDVPNEKKCLYGKDADDGQKLENFTYPKYMNFSIIRGNWMLISILDYDQKTTKIGWTRWRNDDGKLIMFPTLK